MLFRSRYIKRLIGGAAAGTVRAFRGHAAERV